MDWIAFREPIGDSCGKQQREASDEGISHRTRVQCPTCKQNYSLWLSANQDSGPVEEALKNRLKNCCPSHVDFIRLGQPLFPEN